MKISFLAVLLFTIIFTTRWSFESSELKQVQGDWTLTNFILPGGDSMVVFNGKTPVIRFDSNKLIISGTTGCNRFSGPFRIDKDQLRFDFEKMALTRMACIGDDERIFLDGLKKVTHYKITEHHFLMSAGDTVIMRWQKK